MKKLIKIQITRKDIEKGRRNHPTSCPIALALNREYGPNWCIGFNLVSLNSNYCYYHYRLDNNGRNFIYTFDRKMKVNPTEVILTLEE